MAIERCGRKSGFSFPVVHYISLTNEGVCHYSFFFNDNLDPSQAGYKRDPQTLEAQSDVTQTFFVLNP